MRDGQMRLLVVLTALLIAVVLVFFFSRPSPVPVGGPVYDPKGDVVLWDLRMDDVVAVEIAHGDDRVAVERGPQGWTLTVPTQGPADGARMATVTAWIEDAGRARSIEDAQAGNYGLDPAWGQLRFRTDAASHVIDIGDQLGTGGFTFVRVDGGAVVAVPGAFHRQVWTDPGAFRSHRILHFPIAEVAEVTLRSPAGVLRVHGAGRDWWLDGFTRADSGKVSDLVYALLDLHFEEFLDGVAPEGIADAKIAAEVVLGDGTRHGLDVGNRLPMGQLVANERGVTGAVNPEALRLFTMGPLDLGDRHAFPIRDDDTRVVVERGDRRITLSNEGTGWRDAQGRPAAETLARLKGVTIRYRAQPVDAPGDAWATVRITRADGAERVITVGRTEAEYRVTLDLDGGSPYLVPVAELATALDG